MAFLHLRDTLLQSLFLFLTKRRILRQLIRNTVTEISSQNAVLTQCTFLKKYILSFSKWPLSIDTISQKRKAHALLSFQTIVGHEKVRRSRKAKESSRK